MGKRTEEEKNWDGYKSITTPTPNYKTTPAKDTTVQPLAWLKHLSNLMTKRNTNIRM